MTEEIRESVRQVLANVIVINAVANCRRLQTVSTMLRLHYSELKIRWL